MNGSRPRMQASKESELSPALAHPITLHQSLAQVGLHVRSQPFKDLFPADRIHRQKLGNEFVPRFFLLVSSPGNADGQQQANPPEDDRGEGNGGERHDSILPKTLE